jgi:malonyl-ACP O-methyltransferase BioC
VTRNPASKASVRTGFSEAATTYDQYSRVQTYVFSELTRSMSVQDPKRIMDIGCGTGRHTARLGARYPDAEVIALDVSQSMIDIASRRVVVPNVQFMVRDAETHLPELECDLVVANASLHWFHQLPAAIPALASRVLRGGELAFTAFGPDTFTELRQAISMVMGREVILASGHFWSPDILLPVLRKEFSSVDARQEVIRQPFPSVLELLRSIKYTGTRGDGLPGSVWTPGLVREIESVYRARVRDIWATYQIHYYICRR